MDAVLNVAGVVGAIWLAVSILVAVAWAAVGRRIFRKPPVQPPAPEGHTPVVFVTNDQLDGKRHNRRNGGASW